MEEEKNIDEIQEDKTDGVEKKLTKKQKRALRKKEQAEDSTKKQQNKKIKRIVVWSLFGILVILGFWWLKTNYSVNSFITNPEQIKDSDNVRGNINAQITLIEYADFQCPACKAYNTVVKQLSEIMGDRLRVVYRHFPLAQHQNAPLAAYTAEAAGKQGKFWEMADILYERQSDWSNSRDARDIFISYAEELGLDQEKFLADLSSQEVKAKVAEDTNLGYSMKVKSTPSFFINGDYIQGVPLNAELFKSMIESKY